MTTTAPRRRAAKCPGIDPVTYIRGVSDYCRNCGRELANRIDRPVHTGRRVAPRRWARIRPVQA